MKRNFCLWLLILMAGFILGWTTKPVLNKVTTIPIVTPFQKSSSYVDNYKVVRVIDGDTIEIEGGQKIRYIGMDTPETVDPRKPVQCFGLEASKKNKELVEGKTVRLEKDITDRDQYNRLLRYVWAGETFVNLELLKQGFANSATFSPDVKYQKEFLAAEKEAKENNRGLWSACK